MRNTIILAFIVQSLAAQTTSTNIVANSTMDVPLTQSINYEASSTGKWSYLVCTENGASAVVSQSSPGSDNTGKCSKLTLTSTSPSVWNLILYQDFNLLRPTRYELVFRIKANQPGNTAINISTLRLSTNQLLTTTLQTGIHYMNTWQPVVAYLDFSNYSASELSGGIRLNIHFSEPGEYEIDEVSLRPQYLVTFGADNITGADHFSFDTMLSPFFNQLWNGVFSSPENQVPPAVVGGSTNNATLRYCIDPALGAQPIEGDRSLFIDISAIGGTPTYEVRIETPSISAAADGKKIRFSFWAKTDASMANIPASQQQIRLVPRFQQSSNINVQLSPEWKKFSYDFNFTNLLYPDYRFFRFTFDKVNKIHMDAIALEYIDIPVYTSLPATATEESSVKFSVDNRRVKLSSPVNIDVEAIAMDGRILCYLPNQSNGDSFELPAGMYIIRWSTDDHTERSEKLVVH